MHRSRAEMGADLIRSFGGGHVSFDVYDTLLIRPYARPTDLFKHMEKVLNVPGFADTRVLAERGCRGGRHSEVTLREIYGYMPDNYRHLMDKELEFESRVYCPPQVVEAFNELCQRCTVILISDMYLPSSFIDDTLGRCGLNGYDRIYVSCEHGCNKATGRLFNKVLEDYRIGPTDLSHVGDNVHSDHLVPKRMGISTRRVVRPLDGYFSKHPSVARYYRSDPCLARSMIVSLDLIHSFESTDDFWYEVAYRFGGPLALDYVDFIDDHRREGDTVLFVARDGYNLKRIFDMRHPDQRSEYIYAPRILNILIGSEYRRHKKYKEILVGYFYPEFEGDPIDFFDANEAEIEGKREALFRAYRSTLGDYGDISLVDVTTMKYSSQKLIRDLYPDSDLLGLYYFILNVEPDVPHAGYHVRNRIVKLGDNINITEFLLTSPEPPLEGIGSDGRPVFKAVCDDERVRLDIYDDVTRGEHDFCKAMDDLFGPGTLRFGYKNIRDWLDVLASPMRKDVRARLTEIKWPVDAEHERYVSMVYHPRDSWYHLRKTVLDSMWYVSKSLKRKG